MRLLYSFEELWGFRLSDMHEFLRITESGMSGQFDKFSKWVDERTKGMDQETVNDFIDHYYDDLAMVRDVAPKMLRYAQYLCIFGIYEHEVGTLCRILYRDGRVRHKPPKTLHLRHAEKFLNGRVGFRKKAFGKDWKFTLNARHARNAIAHNYGRLRADERGRKAKAFIGRQRHLKLDHRDRIIIELGFCNDLLSRMEAAMGSLLAEAETKYP